MGLVEGKKKKKGNGGWGKWGGGGEAPPGASLAICGGCHQVIGKPDAQGDALARGQDGAHGMAPDMSHQREMTAIISCPSCSLQLQPPPGAPLVACGGCGQVMQVPGVARLE